MQTRAALTSALPDCMSHMSVAWRCDSSGAAFVASGMAGARRDFQRWGLAAKWGCLGRLRVPR
jgi:hypothetical protein